MIYLFCNTGYGEAYLREFIKYSRIRNFEKHIVFSSYLGKTSSKTNRLHNFLGGIRRTSLDVLNESVLSAKYRIKVSIVSNVNNPSFYSKIRKGDRGIISGFNQIFKKNIIDRFDSLVNFHPSLLPFYRGPVPSYWCIKNGEKYSGFTLHEVSTEIDQGKILYQGGIVEIGHFSNAAILDAQIAERGSLILREYLNDVLGYKPLEHKIVDAAKFYKYKVDYASFPKG